MLGIEKAICLCLDKRKDEWEDLQRQCESKGIEFEKFIVGDGKTLDPDMYDRIDVEDADLSDWSYGNDTTKIRHYNAFMSHIEIFKRAKEQGLNRFLLLEDDAYFTERFDDVIHATAFVLVDKSLYLIEFKKVISLVLALSKDSKLFIFKLFLS